MRSQRAVSISVLCHGSQQQPEAPTQPERCGLQPSLWVTAPARADSTLRSKGGAETQQLGDSMARAAWNGSLRSLPRHGPFEKLMFASRHMPGARLEPQLVGTESTRCVCNVLHTLTNTQL